jgi:hypothetical protein
MDSNNRVKYTHMIFLSRDILFRFVFFFGGYFQLFLVYFYMLSGHSAVQEINNLWKFTSGFIGPQILNFARSLSLSPGPQSSLVPPCKISFGGPVDIHGPLQGSQSPELMYRLNTPLIGPVIPPSSTSNLCWLYI